MKYINPLSGSFYFLPDVTPMLYCFSCLNIMLKRSEEAKKIYKKIIECYRMPEVKEVFSNLEGTIPSGKELMRVLVQELENTSITEKGGSKEWMPDVDFFTRFFNKAKTRDADEKRQAVVSEAGNSNDLNYLVALIGELIKVGFNRESEQAKGRFIMTAESSPRLFLAVYFKSYLDFRHVEPIGRYGRSRLMIDGNSYDFTALLSARTNRAQRRKTKAYKASGYKLLHDKLIDQTAEHWYMSRVIYSGPTEYCNKLSEKEIAMEPANLSAEIKPCDEAMGYPRSRT